MIPTSNVYLPYFPYFDVIPVFANITKVSLYYPRTKAIGTEPMEALLRTTLNEMTQESLRAGCRHRGKEILLEKIS